jgi:hypothetical protein
VLVPVPPMDRARGSAFLLGVLLAGTYHATPSPRAVLFP